jgi:hypothetical protein
MRSSEPGTIHDSLDYELQLRKRCEGFFRLHSMRQKEIEKTSKGCDKGMSQPENEIEKTRNLGSLGRTQKHNWLRRYSIESELKGGEENEQLFYCIDQVSMCLFAGFHITIIMMFGQGWGVLGVAVLCLPFFFLVAVLYLRHGVLVLLSKIRQTSGKTTSMQIHQEDRPATR